MKFLREPTKYTLFGHKGNQDILKKKKLETQAVLVQISNYNN
jgi:hypothetical protein